MSNKEINRIKVVLAVKKIKNKWLVEKLKKNPSSISQWCTNERQPSLDTLLEMSILLEIDIRELLISTK
ncbi:MAG: helix-turn-helix transcriptional regulator [Bacteroidales bacterium]|nr:helix-turn-helix transcriptional regulator [Bacteroidales bacterium]